MKEIICGICGWKLKDGDEYVKAGVDGMDKDTCKLCHLKTKYPVEVYSRVVGYIRPISQWNRGKRTEYDDRKEYKIN